MKLKILLLVLTLSLRVFASNLPAGESKGVAFRSLPVLPTDDKSHFLLPMTVEETRTDFLLDTGSGYSVVVSLEMAKALKKDLGKRSEMEGLGGASEAYEVSFDQFELGGVYPVKYKQTHVTDLSGLAHFEVDGKPVKARGIIGSLTLMAVRGVFDTVAGRILVPPGDAGKGVYKKSMEARGALILPMAKKAFARPYIEVTIKGKDFLFLVDTGASTCLLEPAIARELGLEPTGVSSPVVGTGGEVEEQTHRIRVKDVMLAGKVKIPELSFTVLKTKGFEEENISYGGIIGTPVLNALNAQLDFDTYSIIIPRS